MITALLLLAAVTDQQGPRVVKVDRLELNSRFTWEVDKEDPQDQGHWSDRQLHQWIIWEFDYYRGVYVVRDWMMCKSRQRPVRMGNCWVIPLMNKDEGIVEIHASVFDQTYTENDPELDNRDVLLMKHRISCWGEK